MHKVASYLMYAMALTAAATAAGILRVEWTERPWVWVGILLTAGIATYLTLNRQ